MADVDVVTDRVGIEDHPAMVPDPHPTPQPDSVRQADPAGPLDPAIEEAIDHRQRRAEKLGQAHPPVAEAVDGDRPEPLLAEVVVVGAQVLAHERQEPDPRRVEVAVSPVQRGSSINGPGRVLDLDLNLGDSTVGVIVVPAEN